MSRIFDIIEYMDEGRREIVRRFPEQGSGDFRLGSQLIVREGQAAVFFRDGKALDVFGPGRHTITTANVPMLVDLIGKVFSGQTPFKAEVYFVTLRELTDMKWGTPQPVTIQDPILGMARIIGHGTYAMQVTDPQLLVNKVVGTQNLFTTRDVETFFRSIILTKLMDIFGELNRSVIQMAGFAEEISAGVRAKAAEEFAARGVTLTSFYIESISPTEETAKAIDARASMGAIGDMGAYMQYQAAQAMRDAANKPGGGGGSTVSTGVELGAGLGLGAAMAQMVSGAAHAGSQGAGGPAAPAAGPAAPTNPTTPAEIEALLDNLDAQLASGKLSEDTYNRLYAKWEAKLKSMKP